jgi:zinc transporter ZupT
MIFEWFKNLHPIWQAFLATCFTWFLTAAGAMIFVVVEELIPESQLDKNTDLATMGAMVGFTVMMTLDVALG